MKRVTLTWVSVALAGLVGVGTLAAQTPKPLGGEFRVNVFTLGSQLDPAVGMDGSGGFVVAWQSGGQDGPNVGIFARRYDSSGSPIATEFQVNTYTVSAQALAAIDVNASGAFVIAWQSNTQDGDGYGIFGRRFDSSGAAQAIEFQAHLYTTGIQLRPAVGIDDDGDFVIVWNSERDGSGYGIFGRRFNSAGTGLASEFQAHSYTTGTQGSPSIDLDADGDFVIAWHSEQDTGYGIFGQRFGSTGAALGPEFQVNTYITGSQVDAEVAIDSDGDFVVVWSSYAIQDGNQIAVIARRFNSAGTPLNGEIVVNSHGTGYQYQPDVAMDTDGDFVVTWTSYSDPVSQDGSEHGIFMRRFRANGATFGPDLQVNTEANLSQKTPVVASDRDGDFVIAWTSEHLTPGDIFAQRWDVQPLFDVDGNGVFDPLTDGLLILRFGFGFGGATLVNGAVGPGCTRCNPSTITPYLQTFL